MRTRIGVVGVVVLLGVLMAATVAPEAVGNILVSLSVLVFVWAVVGLIKPRWGHIPNRMASVWVWAISVGLFTAGALISAPPSEGVDSTETPRRTERAVDVEREVEVDDRIHPASDVPAVVHAFIQQEPIGSNLTQARAYNNDLTVTVSPDASGLIASQTCDQQRDFAASRWLRWSALLEEHERSNSGAGIAFESPTGRVIASAEQGFTGPRFHCE